jgi:hypothetical protein
MCTCRLKHSNYQNTNAVHPSGRYFTLAILGRFRDWNEVLQPKWRTFRKYWMIWLITVYLIFPCRNFILKYSSSLSDHEILSVCRTYGSTKVSTGNNVFLISYIFSLELKDLYIEQAKLSNFLSKAIKFRVWRMNMTTHIIWVTFIKLYESSKSVNTVAYYFISLLLDFSNEYTLPESTSSWL